MFAEGIEIWPMPGTVDRPPPVSSFLGDFVVGEQFQCAHHGRVIPCLAAMGRTRVEQFQRCGGIRQRHADGTGAGKRQIEVLLMQFDAKAWMLRATMIWLATLQVCPSPLPPTSVMFLPISANNGFTASKASAGPPTMMVRLA